MQLADQINLAIAIISGCSVVVSLFVVAATFKILKANQETVVVMREQIRNANRPYVQVRPWIRSGTTIVMLSIENSGASPAENLRLTIDKDFYSFGENTPAKNLRSFTAFSDPIESLAPKSSMAFILGPGYMLFSKPDICPTQFTVSAQYKFGQEEIAEKQMIDLQPFRSSVQLLDPIVEQLEHLNTQLKHLVDKIQP